MTAPADFGFANALKTFEGQVTEATLIWFEAIAMYDVAKETPQTLKCRQPDALVLGHGDAAILLLRRSRSG